MEENNINNSEKTPYEEPQIKVTDEAFYEDKTSGQQEDEAVPHIEVVGEQWQKGAEAEKDDGKQEEAKEEGTQKTPREIVKTIVRLFKNFNRLTRILIIVAAVTAVGIGIYSMQQRAKHKIMLS